MFKLRSYIDFPRFNAINRMSREVAREMVIIGHEIFGVHINRQAARRWLDHCCGTNGSWVELSTQEYFLFHDDAFVFTYEYLGIERLILVDGKFIVNPSLREIEKQYYKSKPWKSD